MVGFVEGRQRYRGRGRKVPGLLLSRLGGQVALVGRAAGNGAEPLFGQTAHFRFADRSGHDQNGVLGRVVLTEKAAHVVHDGVFDVRNLLANGVPLVGVALVGQGLELEPDIAVGLIEVALLELLDHHFTLHFEAVFGEGQVQHPVAFEPEAGFEIGRWQREVIVGDIRRSEGVVFAPHALQRLVVARNID